VGVTEEFETPPGTPPGGGAAPAVEVRGVTKIFPGVVANDDVSLSFNYGEVHCLLGENGAGKSTLMNILSGMYRPDAGTILVDGREVLVESPKDAHSRGIGMVYQHPTLIPVFTVLQNLMLGESTSLRLDVDAARKGLAKWEQALGVEVDADAETGRLALGQQQQIEIIKALWSGSRVLILDEPTSMLTPQGIEELERALLQLKERGLAIIFITHKLHEALDIGDRVSILRQGRVAGSLDPEFLRTHSREEIQSTIVATMFGEEAEKLAEVAEIRGEVAGRRTARTLLPEPLLELVDISVEPRRDEVGIHELSLQIRMGEIMGVAGVDGNGQRELAEAASGQRALRHGKIVLAGQDITKLSVSQRQQLGLRYVTDDRLGEGTVGSLSVALNLTLKRIGHDPFWRRGGRICTDAIDTCALDLVEDFDIRTPGIDSRCGTLSGGNLQKLVLARELSFDPKVVVYSKPTYGLDVKTTRTVRDRIYELADGGVSALLISTDLEELLDLCDRIAVLFRGHLRGIVENRPGAEQEIGRLMIGGDAA
jgi:ABC-type uncharacterized transport system ATPase subunit